MVNANWFAVTWLASMALCKQLQLSACGIPSKSFGGSGAKQLERSWNRTFLAAWIWWLYTTTSSLHVAP